MMVTKKAELQVGVIDTETDPFKIGRTPKPFAAEFYSDTVTLQFWGDDCIAKLVEALAEFTGEWLIYAHNGGKFDFHFMYEYLDNPIKIIHGRIVSAKLGEHTVRDSFALMPIPLSAYSKRKIDYAKMERHRRGHHKAEILDYLHDDCFQLYSLVIKYIENFSVNLTVGATAMKQVIMRHEFEKMAPRQDAFFRPWYHGGRVQCFRAGIINGDYKVYDVNSMYPKVMRDMRHPVNGSFEYVERMPDTFERPFFVEWTGANNGAVPVKMPGEDLRFDIPYGTFHTTSHEIDVALRYGLIRIDKVIQCAVAREWISFVDYVDYMYAWKVSAKKEGDKAGELFAKFMLNSAYGKFGQNPDNFEEWFLNREAGADAQLSFNGYELYSWNNEFELWKRPAVILDSAYFDVSIAASITGGARSILLDGIMNAEDPLYCDTDSLICRNLNRPIDEFTLGAWKVERVATQVAIAGKKLYGLRDDRLSILDDKRDKIVTKGGRLTYDQISRLCGGEEIEHQSDVPIYSASHIEHGAAEKYFVKRRFNRTVGA